MRSPKLKVNYLDLFMTHMKRISNEFMESIAYGVPMKFVYAVEITIFLAANSCNAVPRVFRSHPHANHMNDALAATIY